MRRKFDRILAVEKDGKERKVSGRRDTESFLCLLSFSKESKLVLIRARVHPFPFRTRTLSSLLPKILAWRRAGKIGSANTKERSGLTRPDLFYIPQ